MNKKKYSISKKKMADVVFFFSYGIYLFFTMLNMSFFIKYIPQSTIKIVMMLCVVLIIFRELLYQKTSYKEMVFLTVCILMTSLILYHLNKSDMIPFFLLIYSSRKIKFEKIAKFTLIETGILFIVIIISAKTGIIFNYSFNNGIRQREYLGFRYSLYPQMFLFNITALYLYINRSKKSIFRYIIVVIANTWLFECTDARLSFYLSIVLIIGMLMINLKPEILKKRKIIVNILCYSFVICATFSLTMIINYDSSNSTMKKLDEILEKRLSLGHSSLSEYPVNLLGNEVHFVGNGLTKEGTRSNKKYNYVDCFYLNIIEKYGILFFLILITLLTYTSIKMYKTQQYEFLIIFAVLALHNIIDDLAIYLYFNTFWFVIGQVFITQISKNTKGELIYEV